MVFWKRKKEEEKSPFPELDLIGSLQDVVKRNNLDVNNISLAINIKDDDRKDAGRENVFINSGKAVAEWRVDSLRALFRGDKAAPSDGEMDYYPHEYRIFFYDIENSVNLYCKALDIKPTDSEFIELYTQMRRRPDGRSLGPLHDTIWQSAALSLGLRPWSEAQYMAVFGQMTRSARHFKIGHTSRNYFHYLLQVFSGETPDVDRIMRGGMGAGVI